ncbi:MAG: hypothetical protein EOO04_27110 [Chitinophagaceae bacterium]|nr:MAG: hypothetical protein EOO04_27110 [Chitinophagaceae bacterium]
MLSTINQNFQPSLVYPAKTSIVSRFMNWADNQQESRLMWLGLSLAGHGCFLTPLTVALIAFTGMNLVLFMAAMIAMTMSLIVNLAALPTKITIPVLVLSILIDIVVIISAFSLGNIL